MGLEPNRKAELEFNKLHKRLRRQVGQAIADCLGEAMDAAGFERVLKGIESGAIEVKIGRASCRERVS